MDGGINHQGSSYRQGLVLGLTMAEIMVLLVFCLLIAMATFLRSEQSKLADAKTRIEDLQRQGERDRAAIALGNEAGLVEKFTTLAGADPAKIDEYWRDLVDAKAAISELKSEGTSLSELRDKASEMATLRKAGIDANTALRNADIVAAIKRVLPDEAKKTLTPQSVADVLARAAAAPTPSFPGPGGHQWPPIISLSEANGYTFKTGSAELSREFREALLRTTADEILTKIQQYDVDVIEVVGHTDEQAYGGGRAVAPAPTVEAPVSLTPAPVIQRQSNLDRGLTTVLKSGGDIARLTPVDNAGLGLARAVSVVSVLRASPKLSNYKMIPLSGGQLINTDETLSLNPSSAGDVAQRRRIEIRLRKSAPHEASAVIATPPAPAPRRAAPKPMPPRPVSAPLPSPSRPPALFGTVGN